MQAAVDGTMEVYPAVLTSVATTIIAFTPLLLLSGTRMEMMFHMAIVVVVSLFFSLFEAFFVLPAHLSSEKILRRKSIEKKRKGIKKYFENFIVWLRDDIYHHALNWLLRWRHAVIGVPVAFFLITFGLLNGGFIKTTFFPMVDFDSFQVNIAFTPGDGEKQTKIYLDNFEKVVWEVNDELVDELNLDTDIIDLVSKSIGNSFSGQEIGSHAGNLNVYPINLEGIDISGHDISNRVREKIGKIPEARKFTVAGMNRWGSPVSISLMSKNLHELEEAKDYLMSRLTELPQLKDINENVALGKQEVRLKLKPKAYFL
jgi:multidrug efflux pump subunit AcrB